MRSIVFLSIIVPAAVLSCSKDVVECGCQDIVNKRWFWVIDRDNIDHDACIYFEDFILRSDGNVDVFRYGMTGDGTVIKDLKLANVSEWSFIDQQLCKIKISNYNVANHDPSFLLTGCQFGVYALFSLVSDSTTVINVTDIECNKLEIGIITFTDYEP